MRAADAVVAAEAVAAQLEVALQDATLKVQQAIDYLQVVKRKPGRANGQIWWMERGNFDTFIRVDACLYCFFVVACFFIAVCFEWLIFRRVGGEAEISPSESTKEKVVSAMQDYTPNYSSMLYRLLESRTLLAIYMYSFT